MLRPDLPPRFVSGFGGLEKNTYGRGWIALPSNWALWEVAGRRQTTDRTDQRRGRGRPRKVVHETMDRQEAAYLLACGAVLWEPAGDSPADQGGPPWYFDYRDPHTHQCVRTWQWRCCVRKAQKRTMWEAVHDGGYTDNSRMWQPAEESPWRN